MLISLQDISQFESLLDTQTPFLIYKYNPNQCPLSEKTKPIIHQFLIDHQHIKGYLVDVTQQQDLKHHIADHTSIRHESPQALLFIDGQLIDATSHMKIKQDWLKDAFSL